MADYVGERMGQSLDELISAKKKTLRKMEGYRTMTESDLTDAAYEEVVADALETVLSDGNVLEDLATYLNPAELARQQAAPLVDSAPAFASQLAVASCDRYLPKEKDTLRCPFPLERVTGI